MNFYKHHIGDYDADTAHLSWLEDAAYRRLLCLYYRREQPIPADITQACRLVRATSKQEREAVESVLREFFVLEADGWRHGRCDDEIIDANESSVEREAKAENERERQRRHRQERSQLFADLRVFGVVPTYDTQTATLRQLLRHEHVTRDITPTATANQTPDSRLQNNPPTPRKRGGGSVHAFPPGFEAFWTAYPKKAGKPSAARAFARLKPDETLLQRMLSALGNQRQSDGWTKDGGQFIPHPATWLNDRRWEDESSKPDGNDLWAGAR